MKRRVLITIIAVGVVLAALILYSILSGKEKAVVLETEVQQGEFEIAVMVTGELQAISEKEIMAPSSLRSQSHRISRIKIQSLIPEGTVVDSGDWIATLDRSDADNELKDILDRYEEEVSEYTRTKLDTTLQLRQLRDELINLEFNMEEAEITLEQSKYEPPATIRQAEINLDKAERAYKQALQNYDLKVQQAAAQMREAEISLERDRRRIADMKAVLANFDIRAPAGGMVIYKREWNGQKRTAGAEINMWDLTVATLPDLSSMISRTYVNEIDISKLKVGQSVEIGVDAFPDRKYTGEVIEVANIGEQLPNTDAKVFEVRIAVNENDTIMRPSMTTSNRIITNILDSVIYIPLEAVHTNDSITFVYTMAGKRQVVVLGESNENSIVIDMGLKRGEKLFLSVPENPDNFEFTGLELVNEIKMREAEKAREREMMNNNRQNMMQPGKEPEMRSGGPPSAR